MKEIIARMEVELAELLDKTTKLRGFVSSEAVGTTNYTDKETYGLLTAQLSHMQAYHDVLEIRLEKMKEQL